MITTSYETSLKLKEIGVPQKSHAWWLVRTHEEVYLSCEFEVDTFTDQFDTDPSAFTSDELLEMIDRSTVDIVDREQCWDVGILRGGNEDYEWGQGVILCEALAEAIIKAHELGISILKEPK